MKLFRCFCRRANLVWPQLLLGLLVVGCSSLQQQHDDPINPKRPFAFPGQTPTTPAVAATTSAPTPEPASVTAPIPSPAPSPTPAPASVPVAVMPVIPGSTPPVISAPTTPAPAAAVTQPIPTPTAAANRTAGAAPETFTVLRSGDTIEVSFSDLPPTAPLQPVRTELDKDGKVTLHYNITVFAVGKNTRQLEQEIRAEYVPKFFKYLTVTVRPEVRYFHVNGEVKQPSMYPWKGEPTVLRAIGAAGGITDWGKKEAQLTRSTGEKFVVKLKEAENDSKKDLPVFPGDYIYVPRKSVWGF